MLYATIGEGTGIMYRVLCSGGFLSCFGDSNAEALKTAGSAWTLAIYTTVLYQ